MGLPSLFQSKCGPRAGLEFKQIVALGHFLAGADHDLHYLALEGDRDGLRSSRRGQDKP